MGLGDTAGSPQIPAPRTCSSPARALPPRRLLQAHLVQVDLALRILKIQLQFKCCNSLLGDFDVFPVGHGVEVLGKTDPPRELSELAPQGTPVPQTPALQYPRGKCISQVGDLSPLRKEILQVELSGPEGEQERTQVQWL